MKVPKEHLPMILSGALTTMRRPAKGPAPTGTHVVHRPGGKVVCRIAVLEAVLEPFDCVTDEIARLEGYPDAATYRDEWCRFYGAAWTGEMGWKVRFRLELSRERQSFLAPAARKGDGSGYLTRPQRPVPKVSHPVEVVDRIRAATSMVDEPEAVASEDVERLPSTLEARQRHQRILLEQQKAREALPLSEIVARELEAARAAGVDTRVYEESILRRVRALRNRTRRAA